MKLKTQLIITMSLFLCSSKEIQFKLLIPQLGKMKMAKLSVKLLIKDSLTTTISILKNMLYSLILKSKP